MSVAEAEVTAERVIFDAVEIQKILPHRYPFLLIDKVVEFEDNQRIVGVKNVTVAEPWFTGHFPGHPVMPGVLIIESMAQAAAILAHRSVDGVIPGKKVYLVGANDLKWKKMVVPGDTMRIEMVSVRKRRPMWIMQGTVTVEGKVVASGTLNAVESE